MTVPDAAATDDSPHAAPPASASAPSSPFFFDLSSWSDEEVETMITTLFAFAFASILVYWFLLRPVLAYKAEEGNVAAAAAAAAAANAGRQGTPNARRRGGAGGGGTGTPRAAAGIGGGAAAGDEDDDPNSISSILRRSRRRPPHLAANAAGGLSASSLLREGTLPFRATSAATYEARVAAADEWEREVVKGGSGGGGTGGGGGGGEKPGPAQLLTESDSREDVVLRNRKERARLFTRLFSPSVTGAARGSVPPSRGSNVVVSVPSYDLVSSGAGAGGCPKLRRALMLLGTYYSLFVVLVLPPKAESEGEAGSGSDGVKDEQKLIQKLRDSLRGGSSHEVDAEELPEDVLPDHRVVAVRSVTGRVAFARQLSPRPEFVLDFDPEIGDQLGRFGFTVLLYSSSAEPSGSGGGDEEEVKKGGSSALGGALLP